ncbi:MAG TPA: PAC2 family protein [Micromonosporaceae bacterium]|nr:PAC2 family protein [Micromonosporaceae bacterium]
MPDAHELYELAGDLAQLDRPVLVQAMTGFVDAGGATRLARDQMLAADNTELFARFDIDALLDYRSRRPTMQFVEDHWESYEEPQLAIFRAVDQQGTPFLLLTGPEPDLSWERFTAAVIGIVERVGVRLTVGFNSIPMAVPHTRPTGVTAHASRHELIAGYEPWLQRVQVPGSAGHLLEYRLGQQGHDAMGFAVHVPHYLAQTEFPPAAEQLITSLSRSTGLLLATEALRTSGAEVRAEVDRQIAENPEAVALVESLETQYDTYLRGRATGNLLAASGPLPTAEELGAELERFLANQTNPPGPPNPPGDQPNQ